MQKMKKERYTAQVKLKADDIAAYALVLISITSAPESVAGHNPLPQDTLPGYNTLPSPGFPSLFFHLSTNPKRKDEQLGGLIND